MMRPLEGDCELKLFTFESDEGRDTFWHSGAHILGQALEMEYGCKLCIGPCTTRGEGFYYDAFYGDLGLKHEFGLKPMNCPGHCLMFQHRVRSYRELPLRLADFGVLHRNEASGALTGLTRVRRFQQDDTRIFCRESQIKEEVRAALEFIKYCYDVLGFTFDLKLLTRPEKYLGDLATWEKAEAALTEALNEFGKPWQINEGDGAFYGPKIDISVSDALKKEIPMCNVTASWLIRAKREAPVMIHRAVLGSVERMFAILLEYYKGKWPFWLSPRQAIVCPVQEKSKEYALKVRDQIHQAGYYVDVDITDRKIQKKAERTAEEFIRVLLNEHGGLIATLKERNRGLSLRFFGNEFKDSTQRG